MRAWVFDLDGVIWRGDIPDRRRSPRRATRDRRRPRRVVRDELLLLAPRRPRSQARPPRHRGDGPRDHLRDGRRRVGARRASGSSSAPGPGVVEALHGARRRGRHRRPRRCRRRRLSPRVRLPPAHRGLPRRVGRGTARRHQRRRDLSVDRWVAARRGSDPRRGHDGDRAAPTIAGKPYPPMCETVWRRLGRGPGQAVVVGDRPDTDGRFAAPSATSSPSCCRG